jgi:hypothetical protein
MKQWSMPDILNPVLDLSQHMTNALLTYLHEVHWASEAIFFGQLLELGPLQSNMSQ